MPYKSYAEFARTKGAKDKGKRKSRAGMIAGGVAGAGALGAGGIAAGLSQTKAYATGRANNQTRLDSLKMAGQREVNRGKKAFGKIQKRASALRFTEDVPLAGAATAVRRPNIKADDTVSALVKAGKNPRRLTGLGKASLGVGAGAGLLAAAGGTAAVLNYLKNRKKKDTSLRGRASAALNRMRGR